MLIRSVVVEVDDNIDTLRNRRVDHLLKLGILTIRLRQVAAVRVARLIDAKRRTDDVHMPALLQVLDRFGSVVGIALRPLTPEQGQSP